MALQYRFMPWVRRGLARTYATPNDGVLEARPRVAVGLTVQATLDGAPAAPVAGNVHVRLYGPADVIGVDTRLIVRTEPKPFVSNFEPNYLAAVDFDPPDFPWMFTPAKADLSARLRPWLVLLVLDRDNALVKPPQMRGGPLPRIDLSAEQARSELPRLSESWMWAHAQAASEDTVPQDLAVEMRQEPDRNISRLFAPRRLEPTRRYFACLVPAFEVGRKAGLGEAIGGEPNAPIPLDAAWPDDPAARAAISLPVYFHWEFSTGVLGDFETLARNLTTPKNYPAGTELNEKLKKLGTAPVLLDADRLLTQGGVKRTVTYEGALVSLTYQSAGAPDADVAAKLSAVVNAPDEMNLALGPAARVPTIAPPIYGAWHTKRHTVPPAQVDDSWLADLNLDPRYRLAAGYGAEVIRQNQEDYMQAAWAQVGEVLKAEMALNFGRLAYELGRNVMKRHFAKLPPERLLSVVGPARGRILLAPAETVEGRISKSSLPDAVIDPALRRLTSAQRPALKAAVRRAGTPAIATQMKTLFDAFSAASQNQRLVDPTRFIPDGILGTDIYDGLDLPDDPGILVDLAPLLGVPRKMSAGAIRAIREGSQTLRAAGKVRRLEPTLGAVRQHGLLTETHRLQFAALQARSLTVLTQHTLAAAVREADVRGAEGMLLSVGIGQAAEHLAVMPLMIDGRNGALRVIESGAHGQHRGAVRFGRTDLATVKTSSLKRYGTAAVFATLPPNTLAGVGVAGVPPVAIAAGGAGAFRPIAAVGAIGDAFTVTVPAPIKDSITLGRVSAAFADFLARREDQVSAAGVTIVAKDFPLAATAVTTMAKIQPAVTIPARVSSMLSIADARLMVADRATGEFTSLFAGRRFADLADERVRFLIPPTFDRIMAYPTIPLPMYKPLAQKLRDAFLPGAEDIPNDFVLLLGTNPRFVESYMVGVNHEMGRELLWRGYPTDQRGTPFRQFWARLDGKQDIEPIHRWTYWTALGAQGAANAEQNTWLVLLIRGELLKRFPNTIIYAQKKSPAGAKLGTKEEFGVAAIEQIIQRPIFTGTLSPDMTFVGFPINPAQRPAWCFVLEEQMTEPRFGFDEAGSGRAPAGDQSWKDVRWSDVGDPAVAPGAHFGLAAMQEANGMVKAALRLSATSHAAAVAQALLQRPFRGFWVGGDLAPRV